MRQERFRQKDGQEISWPHMEPAENLNPLRDKAWLVLYFFDIRRLRNMPPPTIREVAEYIDTGSTSAARYVIEELIRENYLTKHENHEGRISGRGIMIRVNFSTVRRLTEDPMETPEIPGLTYFT